MRDHRTRPRRVLFIVSEFAPMVSIGRLRVQSFCRYLPEHNWQPAVLTFNTRDLWHTDDALLDEIPSGLDVHRVRWIHPFDLPFRVIRRLRGSVAAPSTAPAPRPQRSTKRFTGRLAAVKAWLERHLLIPDEAITGVLPMLVRAVQLHRREPFDAVVVSVPAYATWLVGLAMKRLFRIPLLVDYRDLWYEDVLRQWVPHWRRRLERLLERSAIARSDAVTSVTSRYTQCIRDLDPAPEQRLYKTIYSGFDPRLLPAESDTRPAPADSLDMLCVGKLYKGRRADNLVRALGRLKATDRLPLRDWRLTILGHVAPDQQARLDSIIRQYDLAGHIRFEAFVPRTEALIRERRADALVLIVDTGPVSDGVVPGKVFEYLAVGRRILAICPAGETEQLCRNAGHTLIARPDDPAAIENIVATLFTQVSAGPDIGVPPADRRMPYVAGRQAGLLVDMLNRMTTAPADATVPEILTCHRPTS